MCFWHRLFALACIGAMVLGTASSRAAEVKVFSDGPLRTALVKIIDDFRAETNHNVVVVYDTAPGLKAKLAAGEHADVLISLAVEIEDLAKDNKFAATQLSVASIKLALAIRNGSPVPDIKTLDAFKKTLLSADTIIHNNLASGRAFGRQLERIGIAEQLKSKIVVVQSNTVFEELAKRNGNDIAVGQLTQIIANKSIQLVGPVPQEAQSETVYSAGAFSNAKSLDSAKKFVQFLASPKATAAFVAAGAK
jgi:molybdate transport system substrate-binding protein